MSLLHSPKVEKLVDLSNFHKNFELLSSSNRKKQPSKTSNCWVAKTFMSTWYIHCKISSFSKIISLKLFGLWAQIFTSNHNFYAPLIFSKYTLIAWSENERHVVIIIVQLNDRHPRYQILTGFKLVSKKLVYARCFKNGFALELISMYELAYCPWFIVVATAATKGLMSARLSEDWNRVLILHS